MEKILFQEFLELRALVSVLERMLGQISYEEEEDKFVSLAFEIDEAKTSMRKVALRIVESF